MQAEEGRPPRLNELSNQTIIESHKHLKEILRYIRYPTLATEEAINPESLLLSLGINIDRHECTHESFNSYLLPILHSVGLSDMFKIRITQRYQVRDTAVKLRDDQRSDDYFLFVGAEVDGSIEGRLRSLSQLQTYEDMDEENQNLDCVTSQMIENEEDLSSLLQLFINRNVVRQGRQVRSTNVVEIEPVSEDMI